VHSPVWHDDGTIYYLARSEPDAAYHLWSVAADGGSSATEVVLPRSGCETYDAHGLMVVPPAQLVVQMSCEGENTAFYRFEPSTASLTVLSGMVMPDGPAASLCESLTLNSDAALCAIGSAPPQGVPLPRAWAKDADGKRLFFGNDDGLFVTDARGEVDQIRDGVITDVEISPDGRRLLAVEKRSGAWELLGGTERFLLLDVPD
jgi:hypothetical protein